MPKEIEYIRAKRFSHEQKHLRPVHITKIKYKNERKK